jgi:hypothetical protein
LIFLGRNLNKKAHEDILLFLILLTGNAARSQQRNLNFIFACQKQQSAAGRLQESNAIGICGSVTKQPGKSGKRRQHKLLRSVISGYGYDNAITNGAQVAAFVRPIKILLHRQTLQASMKPSG